MFLKYCKIGQLSRCQVSGCEWKKAFYQHCPSQEMFRPPENRNKKILTEIEKESKNQQVYPYRPSEDFNPFYTRRKKKAVSFTEKTEKVKTDNKLIEQIWSGQKQDTWITKIKTI